MVYKTGKLKGELTSTEIRKLIRAHNVLVSIKIPKGASRDDIIAVLKDNKYKVDHVKQALVPLTGAGLTVSLSTADKVLPKPKSKEERLKAKATRDKAVLEKEMKVKAIGVQQGAAIQRLIAKKKAVSEAPKPVLTPIQPVSAAQQKLKKSSDDLKKKWRTLPFTDKQIKKLEEVVPKARYLNIYENRKGTPFGLAVDGIKYKFNKPLQDDTVSDKPSDKSQALSQANEFWDSLKNLKWPDITPILKLFNKGFQGVKDYYIITDTKTLRGFFIISYVLSRKGAETESSDEKEIKKLMTKPQTRKFKIPVE